MNENGKGFEWVEYPNGSATVRDVATGEVMHSNVGPWEEAQALYIAQSRLIRRLEEDSPSPLVVYDVGMGLAANAWAAIEARLALGAGARRSLRLISFENQLEGLELALTAASRVSFLERARPALEILLKKDFWTSSGGEATWEFRRGNFFENLRADDRPEVIFYDFYAPRSCPDLWSINRLSELRASLGSPNLPATLFTYSAATPVRAALLLSGFHVGYGVGTSSKSETTLASTHLDALERPLGGTWLGKIPQSGRPFPWGDHSIPDRETLMTRLAGLPQFKT